MLIRQGILFGAIVLVFILLFFVVRGCQESARESALKDYNGDVAALIRESDTQVGGPFFALLRDPGSADLRSQVAAFRGQADTQYQQAKQVDTPDEMVGAQRSFLMAMEMRRDGLQSIADRISTALSSDAEAADEAINQIAGAMQLFLSSDVIYSTRVRPWIEHELDEAEIGGQRLQDTRFLPGIEWLEPATLADALGQQLTGGGDGGAGREPAPGLHGTGIDSVQVGDLTLDPNAANRITYGPDTEFTVNFTNQGEHDEVDVRVSLRIEGGPEEIRVERNVASVVAGAAASATLTLDSPPPLDTAVTIRVQVRPVPGEEMTDNNRATYEALFTEG